MAEAVARAVPVGHQGVGADGGAQRLDEVVLGQAADGGEEFVFDGGAALGGHPHDPLGVLGQRLDADEQQVAQRRLSPVRQPSSMLRADSSTKKAFPSERLKTRSTSASSGSRPVMPAIWVRTSARVKRASSTRLMVRIRSISARKGRSGCRRWMSSER
ncbi:hypothetical protein SRIMM317S_04706 [Streptomyces rimosus subsp. rimosus]